jgi:hypothetical protein
MRRGRGRVLAIALAWGALARAPSAARAQDAAQTAAAQAIFEQGVELLDKKRYAEACPKLAEASRLHPGGVGIKVRLAECYEGEGKLASAWLLYTQVQIAAHDAQELPDRPAEKKKQDAEREHAAAAKVAALKPRLSKLTIAGPPQPPPGLEVTRDGSAVGAAQWGIAVPVDGGKHVVSAGAPNRQPWSASVDVPVESGALTVTVPDLANAAGAPRSPEPPPSDGPRPAPTGGVPTWAWVTGGGGIALLGVAAGFGAAALSAQSSINTACGGNADTCTGKPADVGPIKTRQDLDRNVFIGLAAAGGAGLVIGIVGIATAKPSPKPPPASAVLAPLALPGGGGVLLKGGF